MADHLLVFLFAVAWPLLGLFSYRRALVALRESRMSRTSAYRQNILLQWTLGLLALALWFGLDRDPAVLGLGLPEVALWRTALGWLLVAVTMVGLLWQLWQLPRADEQALAKLQQAYQELEPLMPHTRRELRWFDGVSLTAGLVEELLWRGFLIWYLAQFLPLWGAVLLSSLAFALGHAYQGLASVPKVFLIGLVLALLYLLTGSLWLPMLAHFLFDALQGRMAFCFLQLRPPQAQAA